MHTDMVIWGWLKRSIWGVFFLTYTGGKITSMGLDHFKTCRVVSLYALCLETSTWGKNSLHLMWEWYSNCSTKSLSFSHILFDDKRLFAGFCVRMVNVTRDSSFFFFFTFFFAFFLVSRYSWDCLHLKNTKIYYLCSYSRKAFAHVSVSVNFTVTLLYLKQVTRSFLYMKFK